jgi:hypothetical protein
MDEKSMIGNKSLSSLLKNKKGMISTLIGGGRDESNLVIPYSLYTSSSSFKIDPDLDNVSVSDTDSDDNEEGEEEGNEEGEEEVEAEMDVIDDDIYEKLLHLMDAENEEMDLGTSPSSSSNISLLIEEQIDKPSITERMSNNSNSNFNSTPVPLFSTNKVNASRKNRKDGRKIKKNTTNKNKDKKGELKEKIHSPKSKSKKIMTATAISHKNQGKVRNKTKKQRKGLMDTLTSIF